ncbi:MAG: hypothetical protein ACFFCE_01735 [Promethearchaeota archaeon]
MKVDYLSTGLKIKEAQDLIEKLYNLGRTAKKDTFAEDIEMSIKGSAFRIKIASMKKMGFFIQEDDNIILTQLGNNIYNAYDETEKKQLLFQGYMNVELHEKLIERFKDTGLNVEKLDKLLIREYDVHNNYASRVAKSIIKSFSYLGVLDPETGEINVSLLKADASSEIKNEKVAKKQIELNMIDNKTMYDLKKVEMLEKPIQQINTFNSEAFETILSIASYLDAIPIEDLSELLLKNEKLTHTKLVFEIFKNKFIDDTISEEEIKHLLKALKQDLNIIN